MSPTPLRIAVPLAAPAGTRQPPWKELAEFAQHAERLGVDSLWSAEGWLRDGVSQLGYLAATTDRIRLGAGILQLTARAPAVTAMTAMTLFEMSGGRVVLGLGASGPRVVEGLHGVAFDRPLERLREHVELIRMAVRGEALHYAGRQVRLPLRGEAGEAMRLGLPPTPELPVLLGTLTPKALELTGEIADGWLGQVFLPEAADVFLAPLRRGRERAQRQDDPFEIVAGGALEFGDDLERLVENGKAPAAFSIGAMGSASKNFYADTYARCGFADAVEEIGRLWAAGKRAEATRRVPDELVLQSQLLGDDARVRERVDAYTAAGVTSLRIAPRAKSLHEQRDALDRFMALLPKPTA